MKFLIPSLLVSATFVMSFEVAIAQTSKSANTGKQGTKQSGKMASQKSTIKKNQPQLREAGKYSTRHSFDGTSLNGKLQEGSLRKIVVENDKSLEDLLGVRKKFDDRVAEESERNASW